MSRPEEPAAGPSPDDTRHRDDEDDPTSPAGPRPEPVEGRALEECDPAVLAQILIRLGCPPETATTMASQLDKRARQLAASQDRTYGEALQHLLSLMRQGWAAREKGI